MYERFTDRARKVMQLANQEARRFNHEHVGTEHILLGIVKEGSGIAANVLKNLGVDVAKVRAETEALIQQGPRMVGMGKLPLTPNSKKVIQFAIEWAHRLGHNYVGTEHLLLGLLNVTQGIACKVLVDGMGVSSEQVKRVIMELLGQPMPSPPKPLTDEEIDKELAKLTAVRQQWHDQMDRSVATKRQAFDDWYDGQVKELNAMRVTKQEQPSKKEQWCKCRGCGKVYRHIHKYSDCDNARCEGEMSDLVNAPPSSQETWMDRPPML